MIDPKDFQFDLPKDGRPGNIKLNEEWYPGVRKYVSGPSSKRIYHPIDGIRAVVIHATAGSSSEGAISVIKDGRASFHWLVPDEDEVQHGHFVWAVIPETLAAWHVRNTVSHADVYGGKKRVNHYSMGIEVVNSQRSSDAFSDWQIEATAKIVKYCWSKYPNLKHVVSHAKLDPGRRTDPGVQFPWDRFKNLVLEGPEDDVPDLVAAAKDASDIGDVETAGCCTV